MDRQNFQMPPSSTSLPHELQILWDEICESYTEKDKMLQEFLDLYNKKVEKTHKYKVELQRFFAHAEAEIASLVSALGENIKQGSGDESDLTLTELDEKLEQLKDLKQISTIKPVLDHLVMIKAQIKEISGDIASDLTLRKLEETLEQLKAQIKDVSSDPKNFEEEVEQDVTPLLSSAVKTWKPPKKRENEENELEADLWTETEEEPKEKPKIKFSLLEKKKKPEVVVVEEEVVVNKLEAVAALEKDLWKKMLDRFIPVPLHCLSLDFTDDGEFQALIQWKDVKRPTWVDVKDLEEQYPSFSIWA